eukprot:4516943-Alexandrium_andersonii.AAC.1
MYPPALCAAILRGITAQRAREGRPVPRRVQDRMNRGVAVFDLTAAGDRRPARGAREQYRRGRRRHRGPRRFPRCG